MRGFVGCGGGLPQIGLWHDLSVAGGSERELSELRIELGRLRAENARLLRLLDLGQDTEPVSEQLAVPMVPGMVTMASPVRDKLALYGDRFRARRDVYGLFTIQGVGVV